MIFFCEKDFWKDFFVIAVHLLMMPTNARSRIPFRLCCIQTPVSSGVRQVGNISGSRLQSEIAKQREKPKTPF